MVIHERREETMQKKSKVKIVAKLSEIAKDLLQSLL